MDWSQCGEWCGLLEIERQSQQELKECSLVLEHQRLQGRPRNSEKVKIEIEVEWTWNRGCFIARIAAIKKVLSPISEAKIAKNELQNADPKLNFIVPSFSFSLFDELQQTNQISIPSIFHFC